MSETATTPPMDDASTAAPEPLTTHRFEADVNQVLSLVVNSLYSNKEIFLRELVSNASDALDKLRFEAITRPDLLADDPELKIRLIPDATKGTLTLWDNGVGMDEAALIKNLGTVAHSGTRAFFEQLATKRPDDLTLIGQFGVGFYSAYLVASKVEVISRPAGEAKAWRWLSDAGGTFQVGPAERETRGTSVILHLAEDQKEFLGEWRLRQLVTHYSDFVSHPIELRVERDASLPVDEDEAPDKGIEWQTINTASALWRRPASELTNEQYEEFYKHLAHDWEPPLARNHFRIEGTTEFTGLLFVPKRRPVDLFDRRLRGGLRLYVRRVFIMDDVEALLPPWLRFLRGVIDSDDLPLNVSRELLQDSRHVQVIRKTVAKKTLDQLEAMAKDQPDQYLELYAAFGAVLKEGLHFDPQHKSRLAKLVRYASTHGDTPVSLDEYVSRMPEGQPALYYALGQSQALVESSPHLEALKKRGWEVLFMTDPVDQWALENLTEFDGKPLVSVMNAELDLDGRTEDEKKKQKQADAEVLSELRDAFREALADKVSEVRVSRRLTDSPVCLVLPEGGLPAHIERLLRATQAGDLPRQQRILEINPDHPLIQALEQTRQSQNERGQLAEWLELLYEQALLIEGSPIENAARFTGALTRLMERALTSASPR
jgi:molecular chaperone HtpG